MASTRAHLEELRHPVERLVSQERLIDEMFHLLVEMGERQANAATAEFSAELDQRLDGITHQIETLRRRIALRARADYALSPEALQMIAEEVVQRISATGVVPVKGAQHRTGQDSRRK
jgi:hypothetical protein